ncbi:MAG: REP element-mobilizing transposase RayT [Alphaproteobacteria bacterium]
MRQGFLLDSVKVNDTQFNYRNEWIQCRLLFLSDVFAIDLLSFAIMDNHTHLVLFANLQLAGQWNNAEVLRRWSKLGKLPLLCQLYLSENWRNKLNDVELAIVLDQIDEYRLKLSDISIFMSRFNYYIAKRANKEDKITGHFWEARFKSQALLDAKSVLSCMLYVDLNPIRAKKSKSLFDSYFTSIKYRLDKAVEYSRALILPLRNYSTLNFESDIVRMSLQSYVQRLEMLVCNESSSRKFAVLDNYSDDETNWKKNTLAFENTFSICAGESQLVALFNKQARLFSGLQKRETQAFFDTILFRLLDSRYLFEKTHPYN